jgi:hypothetical protein
MTLNAAFAAAISANIKTSYIVAPDAAGTVVISIATDWFKFSGCPQSAQVSASISD